MSEQEQKPAIWLAYPLQAGYIHDWLVAGPFVAAVSNVSQFPDTDFKRQVAREAYEHRPHMDITPAERQPYSPPGAEQSCMWEVYRCGDDHYVDLSCFYHTCHHLQTWAFAAVEAPAATKTSFTLTANGPADVWLNGVHVLRHEEFQLQLPLSVTFEADLVSGRNELLVRFEAVAVRACPYVMALHLEPAAGANGREPGPIETVYLPTTIEPAARRQRLEDVFAQAYLDRDLYARDEQVIVRWPEGKPLRDNIALRLMRKGGRLYAEQHTEGRVLPQSALGKAYQFQEDAYQVVLMADPEAYYVGGMRVERRLDLRIASNEYATERYGTYEERRAEALKDAARRSVNVFCEIAKMELGQWQQVDVQAIQDTITMINRRADCSDFYLVGLLGMVARYIEDAGFPDELVDSLRACFLNFRYWMQEPGNDAMCFWTENHQILFHTCEILAGQLLPDEVFSNSEMRGDEHRRKGEQMALTWLHKRASGGFREWDSNTYFEEDVLALSHLADLAEDDDVRELAAVVLDKMLFGLAVNSFKGVFGSTHGRTYAPYIKGAYLEPTSGIGRLLWGKGIFNERVLGTVSLCCAIGYQLPPVIEAIALDPAEAIWNRERHAGRLEQWCDLAEGEWEVNKVTFKTPDYMLASAQDYLPGQPGFQQHVWQATLSPEAVVFVTHPPCISEDGAHRPNFWHGNVVLPRVAQWQDVLVAIHWLPEDDWLGFTHAYFPLYAFEEHALRDGWAFGRVGAGYVALTAKRGLDLIQHGRNAMRELRSYGHENVWLVQMGRAAQDGSFAEFQEKVLALDVRYEDAAIRAQTLRAGDLEFGWTGPLKVDGGEQAITDFLHYDNLYSRTELGADTMDIQFMDLLVRLDFSLDKTLAT